MRPVLALCAALLAGAGAACIAIGRTQPRDRCPLCGRRHPLELHP